MHESALELSTSTAEVKNLFISYSKYQGDAWFHFFELARMGIEGSKYREVCDSKKKFKISKFLVASTLQTSFCLCGIIREKYKVTHSFFLGK